MIASAPCTRQWLCHGWNYNRILYIIQEIIIISIPIYQRRSTRSTENVKAVETDIPSRIRIHSLLAALCRKRSLDLEDKNKIINDSFYATQTMILTSSLVVWLLVVKYVWKPASPITDHTLRKQIIAIIKLNGASLIASSVMSFLSLATVEEKRTIKTLLSNHFCICTYTRLCVSLSRWR